MAYIGAQPNKQLTKTTSQSFNGTGSATAFTLNRAVNSGEELEVFVDNVQQEPGVGKSYTATGTALTFDEAPPLGTGNVYVIYRGQAEVTTRLEAPDLSITTAKIADDAVTSAKLASGVAQTPVSVAVLSHVTAYDTGGGGLTSGAYRTRPLNTEVDPDSIVTLSSNQFTLAAGTYTIDWTCDAYKVDHHWSQIYDITNSATLILGSASYAGSTENIGDVSYGHHIFTITSTTTYELQQQCTTTKNTNGMGNRTNVSGNNSVHAYLKISKLA
tara:strand:- start:29690 stop:30505 length:816 start_codon:yes stop_codon:yes gene_type:complete